MRPSELLVFEPESAGHQAEYLRALLNHWKSRRSNDLRLTLAVSPDLQERLPEVTDLRAGARDALRMVTLSRTECDLCSSGSTWSRSWARWRLLAREVSRSNPDFALAIHLDMMQLPLALQLRAPVPLYGVLFRPSLHYGQFEADARAPLDLVRRRLKALLLIATLRNPSLASLFVHDEGFVAYSGKRLGRGGERIRHVPNPLPPYRELLATGARAPAWIEAIPRERLCFVLFGALSRRKGLFEVLEAIERLDSREARRTALVLAGRVDERIRSELLSRVAALRRRSPESSIVLEDRFISEAELASLLQRADVVLAPYRRFVGSSGVVFWAIAARRPVLAQDYGYLGRFVREHRLGMTADCTDPGHIAAALAQCLARSGEGLCDSAEMKRLADEHAPERFASALLAPAAPIPAERDPPDEPTRSAHRRHL